MSLEDLLVLMRMEYEEMPDLKLTLLQARRLWDVPLELCDAALGALVDGGRLAQVEDGEAFLRGLGVTGDLRVRHLGGSARIEVSPPEIASVERQWDAVETAFRDLGFSAVELDPRGYRRGSLLGLERTGS
jgi:uncharacterized protein